MNIASLHTSAANDSVMLNHPAIFTAINSEDEPVAKPPFKSEFRPFKRKQYKPNQPGQDHGNRAVEPAAPQAEQPNEPPAPTTT